MHDDEPIDPEEVRYVLRRVAAYREVCERVRKGSTGSLIFGGIMLAIWQWALPENLKFQWFGIVYLALAILEFGSGVLNRLFPSAEGPNLGNCRTDGDSGGTRTRAGYPLGELACIYLCRGYTRGVTVTSVRLEASVTR